MTENDTTRGLVRTEEFAVDGPVDLDLTVGGGKIDIRLVEPGEDAVVAVELVYDPATGSPWAQGVANFLEFLSSSIGDFGTDLRGLASDAVNQTRVEMVGGTLLLRTPKAMPTRHVPLTISVTAPAGSHVTLKTGPASVTTQGVAGDVAVKSSSGDVTLDATDGSSSVTTGSGSVRVATVDGELTVRTGSGSVTVADAGSGKVKLKTGSGDVHVGVRQDVLAEVHLSSGVGPVSSELEVSDTPPDDEVALQVQASTGSGSATIAGASPRS